MEILTKLIQLNVQALYMNGFDGNYQVSQMTERWKKYEKGVICMASTWWASILSDVLAISMVCCCTHRARYYPVPSPNRE